MILLFHIHLLLCTFSPQVSEYDHEMPQSHTFLRGRTITVEATATTAINARNFGSYRIVKQRMLMQSKKDDKDQESIQSSTTPYPGYQWVSKKLTITHHKREPRGQPFPSR